MDKPTLTLAFANIAVASVTSGLLMFIVILWLRSPL